MKSPIFIVTALAAVCLTQVLSAEPPQPADAGGRPAPQASERQLSNRELFRLLFESGHSTPASGPRPAGYETDAPAASGPIAPMPVPPGNGACGAPCGTVGCTACCEECPPFWQHRSNVFGEFLYLHARDADVHLATPADGLGINFRPIDNAVMADPAYDPGFRVGGAFALSDCSSLIGSYTWYESSVEDRTALDGGAGFLFPELLHPNTLNVDADDLLVESEYEIDFQFIDLAGSFLLHGDCKTRVNGIAGFRYGRLEQDLFATYGILEVQTVDSQIEFDGFGPRLGVEAERLAGRGCFFYGNAFANFLAGQFETTFVQNALFAPGAPQVSTGHEDDRIVSLLELELGLGWQSRCRRVSARAGYYIAGWFNTITTAEFIQGVHEDDFNDTTGSLTFDGLTARLEYNY